MDINRSGSSQKKWYEKYLPFIARSPQMQIDWLINIFKRGSLTYEEITPYIRLLLEEEQEDQVIRELFQDLDEWEVTEMLRAADIYDTPKLFSLIRKPTKAQVEIALKKDPPPYEKKPGLARNKVFQAIHEASEELLVQAVDELRAREELTSEFEEAYERFKEILMDEKILSSLYPKARL